MKIYKLDSKGKVRLLEIVTENGYLIQSSGLLDGKLVEHKKLCKPKNQGKTNETTEITQSEFEATALVVKKLREGYFETIEQAQTVKVILPMLAQDYFKKEKKVQWPCYGQPKLDGMRGLGNEGTLKSRANKEITTLSHIQQDLENITEYIDGELYAHGNTFQENMTIIKKYRPGLTENVKYHVYDIISDKPFIERYNELKSLIKGKQHIELVPVVELNNPQELEEYYGNMMQLGYEGVMLRWGTNGYKINGRSDNLLKYKKFFDVSVPIVDITPNDAIPTHGTIWVEYKGKVVKTGARLSHTEREEYLTNKEEYIGKTAEVRYFETTDDGSLRFPVFCGIRLDK